MHDDIEVWLQIARRKKQQQQPCSIIYLSFEKYIFILFSIFKNIHHCKGKNN